MSREEHILELRMAGIIPKQSVYRDKKVYVDQDKVFISPSVEIGEGSIIWPNTYILGETKIGAGCEIEPSCIIENSTIDDGTFVGISSRISNSCVGKNCKIWGVRMNQSEVGDDCTLNAFSRLLWTMVGKRCKIRSHCNLEYAQIGDDCELSTGVILTGEQLKECELSKGKRTIYISKNSKFFPRAYIQHRIIIKQPSAQ